ncbi:MAG: hypothetical protein RBR97_20215, partial [Bacteroidales bacterium]|nr:hypothetical protein [Bacteroidales bacterium]
NAKIGKNNYKPLFYNPEWEYSPEFLAQKRLELGERLFNQEYPMTEEDAFLTSGECYFDVHILREILKGAKEPINFQF